MNIFEKVRARERRMNFAAKIRYFYILLLIPIMILVGVCLYNMWDSNQEYGRMIETAEKASEFSIDFKNEFDYEVYLLVIGKEEPERTDAFKILGQADEIVKALEETTKDGTNKVRLQGMQRYLKELRSYTEEIINNIRELEDSYPANIKVWEDFIKVNTSLIRETITQVTYFELQGMQNRRAEFQESYLKMIRYSIIALSILMTLIILFSIYIPHSITRPIRELAEVTNHVAKGDLKIRSAVEGTTEIAMLNDSMNVMIEKINSLLEQGKEEQKQLRIAEFRVLQAQINPHFLYNTLDTIVWLAESGDQKQVVSLVGSLSDFFRTSLNQGKDIITLNEEIQHIRSYLKIQQVRYQDILTYEIDIPDKYGYTPIPKITLQPLIENALYHGIKNKRGGGQIRVTAGEEGNVLLIQVHDNGIGMSEEKLAMLNTSLNSESDEHSSYGLYNVNQRICLNFGNEYGISFASKQGEGTTVTVRLPMI